MLSFLRKSRAAFGNLHHNQVPFGIAILIGLCYSFTLLLTIQSGTVFGPLFNVLLFALLGAGTREGNSLFHGLSLSRKEKVDLAFKTFCFWAVLYIVFKIFKSLIWVSWIYQITGNGIFEIFNLSLIHI